MQQALGKPLDDLRRLVAALQSGAGEGSAAPSLDVGKIGGSVDRLAAMVGDLAGRDPAAVAKSLRHDLRTPVVAIIGYAELIAEEAEDRDGTGLLEPLGAVRVAAAGLLEELDRLAGLFADRAAGASRPGADLLLPDGLAAERPGAIGKARPDPGPGAVLGRLLVVDDTEAMRDLLSRRLAREGHEVETCDNGRSALDRSAEKPFDLMLLDLMMPGMSGLEVLRELAARDGSARLPVIVISALDEVAPAVQCIDAGADDFLSKPIDETLLRARITSSLERKFLRDREQAALEKLRTEQDRSEMLLRNVLPANVVERLRKGETVIADQFEQATVLFCDLVGFTAMSASLRAADTLAVLNDIFSRFDELADRHHLEKIKTIGDAYMLVGGIADRASDHAARVVAMAAELPAMVAEIGRSHALTVRVGIDTGPVAAGIIGRKKFFYDVWGDTVNTASRLEGSSLPGRVHVSDATRQAAGDAFRFEAREPITLHGKGRMQTYLLVQP